ncbi:MAG: hypothetical protein AAF913_13725 [Pseudomonadota bacterium]
MELVDSIVETRNSSVLTAVEAKIEKLERENFALVSETEEPLPNAARFGDCTELALRFLSRPWYIYKNGTYTVRQTDLRLAASWPLTFTPEYLYGTPKPTLPFRVLGGFSKKKMRNGAAGEN